MHPSNMVSASATCPLPNPVAHSAAPGFPPSPWGDRFLHYTPDLKVIETQQEIVKVLKGEIKMELLSVVDKPLLEQLRFIDSIERLGVGYHFEEEIEDGLRRIHEMSADETPSSGLLLTSLHFRLLRQHGFNVPSDVFKKFVNSNGALKEEVCGDTQGVISLYEACHVRVHGEDVLDEVLPFTISKLKSIQSQARDDPLLKERISHALKTALHRRLPHFESVRYVQVYEEDDPLHNKTLLKFAKVDYNLRQDSHKKQLSEMCRWAKQIDMPSKLPLRDRIVEAYFWATGLYSEPDQYYLARQIATMGGQIVTSIDDIYDSYATLEELEIFTEAVYRWDKSGLDQLKSEELRWFYQTLILDAHEEMERLLAPVGRSQYVHYAKQEVKALVKTYLNEARWRSKNYIPTLEEYIANDMYRNTAYIAAAAYTLLGMDASVTDHEFQWISSLPKPVKALGYLLRLHDDIGGKKFDDKNGDSALFLECYMKEYGLSFEQACGRLYVEAEKLWKDVNEVMIQPTEVPPSVINRIMNMSRVLEIIYAGGEDGFTLVNEHIQKVIKTFYIDSIPM